MTLNFKRLDDAAILPKRANPTDSGLDLHAVEDVVLLPGVPTLVRTGWAVELPSGGYLNGWGNIPFTFEAQIRPRSGLAAKHGITVVNAPGTVDNSYRGEIKVILRWDGRAPNVWPYVYRHALPIHWFAREEVPNTPEAQPWSEIHPPAYRILKGERIAQLVVAMVALPEPVEVAELSETARGSGGFGSTGK